MNTADRDSHLKVKKPKLSSKAITIATKIMTITKRLLLWLPLLLAAPKSAQASDGFETDANFMVTYMGNGVIHFRLLFLDCGKINYYMTRKDGVRNDGVLVYMTYNDANGTARTVNAFQLYCPSNPSDDLVAACCGSISTRFHSGCCSAISATPRMKPRPYALDRSAATAILF